MLDIAGSLLQRKKRKISARIPLQSENAFGAFSDSFPPGEAIGAAAPQQPSNCATNWNLYSFLYFLQNHMDFFKKT
jgi:hypothetical protein